MLNRFKKKKIADQFVEDYVQIAFNFFYGTFYVSVVVVLLLVILQFLHLAGRNRGRSSG